MSQQGQERETEALDAAGRLLAEVSAFVVENHPGGQLGVGLDSEFERELGLDSLARVELMLRVGQAFGVNLPDAALYEAQTPRELLRYLTTSASMPGADAQARRSVLTEAATGELPRLAATLPEVLDWHVAQHPNKLCVLLYGEDEQAEEITYGALRDEARRIATGLVMRGVQPKQTVALMLPTSRAYLASFFGVLIAGAVPVPIYPPVRLNQIEDHLKRHARILANAEVVLIITVPQAKTVAMMLQAAVPALRDIVTPEELAAPAMAIAYRATADDLAFLQYTSGSTGEPKGVMLTHANLLANIRTMGEVVAASGNDVFVSWLPLYHDMGLIGAWLGSLYHGFPLVLMSPLAFLARPARWLQAISRHRGTIAAAPNFAYELCARKLADAELDGLDLGSWRLALNGAEPVSPATLEAFAQRFAPYGLRREALTPVYGLAECSVGLAFPPLERGPLIDSIDRRLLAEKRHAVPVAAVAQDALAVPACGRALPGHAMRIVDEHGDELPERRVGRLQFQGPSATAGYYGNAEATRGLVQGPWRETGDYAYLADAELYVTGREKDLIIRGGRNIYPYELEEAVGVLPGVRKGCVAVFGSPEPRSGRERLVVLAETRETDAAARQRLHARINELAVDLIDMPADEIVLAPPYTVLKTSSGKIRRAASREIFERAGVGTAPPSRWRQLGHYAVAVMRTRLVGAARRGALWAYGSYAWALFVLLGVPTGVVVWLLQKPRLAHTVIYYASRLFFRLAGIPFRPLVADRLPAKPHVLVVNHGSYLDSILLVSALPPKIAYAFVAKREFQDHWFFHRFFTGIGAIFVERFDAKRGVEGVERIVETLQAGRSVAVFPEGTFSRETGLRAFRMGAFVAAARAGVPLVAAGLRGVRPMLRDQTWLPRRGKPEFEIGAIIAPTGSDWAAAVRLRDAARQEILRICAEPDLVRK